MLYRKARREKRVVKSIEDNPMFRISMVLRAWTGFARIFFFIGGVILTCVACAH